MMLRAVGMKLMFSSRCACRRNAEVGMQAQLRPYIYTAVSMVKYVFGVLVLALQSMGCTATQRGSETTTSCWDMYQLLKTLDQVWYMSTD